MDMSSLLNEMKSENIKSRFNKGELVKIVGDNGRQTQVLICDVEELSGGKVKYHILDNRGNMRWFEEGMGWYGWKNAGSSWRQFEPYNYSVEKCE